MMFAAAHSYGVMGLGLEVRFSESCICANSTIPELQQSLYKDKPPKIYTSVLFLCLYQSLIVESFCVVSWGGETGEFTAKGLPSGVPESVIK